MKVFISSTSEDLKPYRLAAADVVRDAQWEPIGIEHFPADPRPIVQLCRDIVEGCDLVLLLQAWRCGWVPPLEKGGDGQTSVTALEIAAAEALPKPVLAFLADGKWPGELWDRDPTARDRTENFRNGLNRNAKFFKWEDDPKLPLFRALLSQELANYRLRKSVPPPSTIAAIVKQAQKPRAKQRAPKPVAAPPPVRRIFLCYRRHDSGTIVGRIYDRLARDFGKENIFKDVDNIPFGVDFVDHLDGEVQKCGVLFAVIGPRWLEAGPQNAPQLDDPNDFVRIEIASALRRTIPVVPLLVDGARMPRADQLPDEIKPLARRNGTEIRHDPDFHGDMTRLLSRLG